MSFAPSFDISWDTPSVTPQPVAPVSPQQPKTKLDPFGIDEAFANFQPNFSTEVEQLKLVQPTPVSPVDDISNTVAAKIFSDFCQSKFNFTPSFTQK